MTTTRELITDAVIGLGKFDPEETPAAHYMQHGLRALNRMVKSWATENLMIPYTTSESFALAGGTASYTMGTGGTASSARAKRILNAYYRDSNSLDHPVGILNQRQYNAITQKSLAGIPDRLFYDPTYPIGTIYVWKVPDGAGYTMYIESTKELHDTLALADEISLDGEYEAAIVANLRNMLAGAYGVQITNYMVSEADDLKRTIKNLNLANRLEEMDMPAGVITSTRSWSINEGP